MDIRILQRLVVDALEDVKAQDIRVFSTTGMTDLFDRVIIASGTSNRQTKALAASVRDKVKAAGGDVISVEGEETGEWVLVDLGDVVVHIMQPTIRVYYHLEELWGAKPVVVKSADDEAAEARKKAAAKKTPSTTTPAKKAAAKKAPAKKAAAKKVAAKKAPAKKAPAKKAAARKTPARKSAS